MLQKMLRKTGCKVSSTSYLGWAVMPSMSKFFVKFKLKSNVFFNLFLWWFCSMCWALLPNLVVQ